MREEFSPNLTFSVLYTKGGDYSFQNAGIKVGMPQVEIDIATDKERYEPGETVTVTLATRFAGKPVSSHLTVSVVDEMVYALQGGDRPGIDQFFYHPRRNNVRTSASLAFISYDVALPGSTSAPGRANRSERGVKVLERPRREDVDTAAWQPELVTDAQGKASFSFRMPDSLTRWRITARAIDDNGQVGQKKQFLRSEKPLYLKWSGPTRFRQGDQPDLGLFVFNQGERPVKAELLSGPPGSQRSQPLELAKESTTFRWRNSRSAMATGAPSCARTGRSATAWRCASTCWPTAGRWSRRRTSAWRRRATRCNCRRTPATYACAWPMARPRPTWAISMTCWNIPTAASSRPPANCCR